MQFTRRQALAVTASVCLGAGSRSTLAIGSSQLRLGGTGSANELLDVLGREYQKRSGGTKFIVVPGLGSTGGILATGDNELDLSISARPLKPAEATKLTASLFARTPFVFATSNENPGGQSIGQIARMFADPQSKWPDGAPVRCILRPTAETDTAVTARLFPSVGQAIEVARKRIEVPIAVNDQDNAGMAERVDGSLVGISLMQVRLEKRNLRVIDLDGKSPTLANLESGAYPYGRDLYLVHGQAASAEVQGLLSFIGSPAGAQVLRQCHCQPIA